MEEEKPCYVGHVHFWKSGHEYCQYGFLTPVDLYISGCQASLHEDRDFFDNFEEERGEIL